MGLRFPSQQFGTCFFVTTTYHKWRALGNVEGMYEAIADSLVFYSDKYRATVIGYVLMPTHLHLILVIDGKKLASFMRDFKKFVAQKAAKDLGLSDGVIWKPRYDRVVITSREVLLTKLGYIHRNPVKAGLVNEGSRWRWSSAGDYEGAGTGVIPVTVDWLGI